MFHQKSPSLYQKSPLFHQTSPVFHQKSPIFAKGALQFIIFRQMSPVSAPNTALYTIKRALDFAKRALFPPKEPYFRQKTTRFRQRSPVSVNRALYLTTGAPHSFATELIHVWHPLSDFSCFVHVRREVGGWGRDPFSRNFMKPTPRRKWYLTTGRRFHWMVLDPIP